MESPSPARVYNFAKRPGHLTFPWAAVLGRWFIVRLLVRSAARPRPHFGTRDLPCLATRCAANSAGRVGSRTRIARAPDRAGYRPTRNNGRALATAPVILAARLTPKTSRTHGRELCRRNYDRSVASP